MTRIVLDQTLREKLGRNEAELELCDESGKTLGYFVPPKRHRELSYAWALTQFDDAEIEKAKREPGGMTTEEVLAHLQSLDNSSSE